MTDTPQKRHDAKTKYGAIALRTLQILLDNAAKPGYYGEETLAICSQDGVITHIKRGGQQTHRS